MRQFLHSPSPSPAASPQPQPHVSSRFPHPLAAAFTTTAFSLLLFLLVCFRKITRKLTAPESNSKPPHRYSYFVLRRATDSFSSTRRFGQGGSGSVFVGTIPHTRQDVAVKLVDSGSLQRERKFQNELQSDSPLVVSVLGFSSDTTLTPDRPVPRSVDFRPACGLAWAGCQSISQAGVNSQGASWSEFTGCQPDFLTGCWAIPPPVELL